MRTLWLHVQQEGHAEGPHQREARGAEVRGSQQSDPSLLNRPSLMRRQQELTLLTV